MSYEGDVGMVSIGYRYVNVKKNYPRLYESRQ